MKKSPVQILEEATREELSSCVQLLAQSIVQHRAKFGVINLHQSTESLEPAEDPTVTGMFIQGKEVLEEALEIVRTHAAEPRLVPDVDPKNDFAESRTQFRINISLPVRILLANHTKPVDAMLENISWGGAALVVTGVDIDIDDSLRIILPRPQGGSISIEARILRTWEHPDDGGQGVSVRFSSLSTRDEAKLEDILEHFAQTADDGPRNHARLSQRLDIQFDAVAELQSTLDDISAGGLGITVPDPLQIGQSLQAVISTLDETCSLKLRARVVRQESHKVRNVQFYRVGLKFEHPTEELSKRTNELIGRIAGTKSH